MYAADSTGVSALRAYDAPMGGSDTLRERILALARHEGTEKGVLFERWLVETLPQMPSTEIVRAWRWQDTPAPLRRRAFGRSLAGLPDTGVDILAERSDGGLIAVQAKCLRPDKALVLDDLKQFWLKAKGNRKLAANWVVTTGEWGRTVVAHANDANGALINAQTEWGDIPVAGLGRVKPLALDANQKAAWKACVDGLGTDDRGKLVMACGTGKTLVSLRVAEKITPAGGIVVYATPSIALTGQSRRSWLQNAKRPMRTMVVCSDEDEGAGGAAPDFSGFVSEIEAPVSTDPSVIAARVAELQRSFDGVEKGLVAVFATYQSLHRVCTAQKNHGLDCNPRAVQIAATQLTMGGLSADFRNMGLWTLPRGHRPGGRDERGNLDATDVLLGSMELLLDTGEGDVAGDFAKALASADEANRTRQRQRVAMDNDALVDSALSERLGRTAIALTNPPFSSLKNQASDAESHLRTAMASRMDRMREIVGSRWREWGEAMSADSVSPPFSFLLAERINHEHGVVGKVAPTTICTNRSKAGIAERRFLAAQFQIDSVVTLHDPRAFGWSVKGQQESLLLMRRAAIEERPDVVRFASVARRPSNAEQSTALYEALRDGDLGDLGTICLWPRDRVEAGDWSPAVFYSPDLAHVCFDIDHWVDAKPARFARLGDLYAINTTKQTVGQSKWEWCDEADAEVPVAKDAKESAQTCLRGVIDGWSRRTPALRGNERERENLVTKSGRLLVTNTQNASSARLTAVAFRSPVVGYAWTPVQAIKAKDAQALAVWINSTIGRILLRKYASRSTHWPMYQPAAIKALVVPNTAGSRWPKMREPLLAAYNATKDTTVPQYREPDAEVRARWDIAVAKAAGIPRKTVDAWRKLLDAEPFVTGKTAP